MLKAQGHRGNFFSLRLPVVRILLYNRPPCAPFELLNKHPFFLLKLR
jgi:hypothetical protein